MLCFSQHRYAWHLHSGILALGTDKRGEEEHKSPSSFLRANFRECEDIRKFKSTVSSQISRFVPWMFLHHSPDNRAGILMFL